MWVRWVLRAAADSLAQGLGLGLPLLDSPHAQRREGRALRAYYGLNPGQSLAAATGRAGHTLIW